METTVSTVVMTTGGAVRGTHEDGVLAFRGIPYAEPPVVVTTVSRVVVSMPSLRPRSRRPDRHPRRRGSPGAPGPDIGATP